MIADIYECLGNTEAENYQRGKIRHNGLFLSNLRNIIVADALQWSVYLPQPENINLLLGCNSSLSRKLSSPNAAIG